MPSSAFLLLAGVHMKPMMASQGTLVLHGGSGAQRCVHDPSIRAIDGVPIAAQCCDGAVCRRRTSPSNSDCIAGLYGTGSFRRTTWADAAQECRSRELTLCDSSCRDTGCNYNAVWVWTSLACPLPLPLPPPPPPPPPPPLSSPAEGPEDPPNFVILFTDDQQVDEIALYGGPVLTPGMDRIGADGVKFTAGYVTSAVCTPSRWSLLTGQYASRNSIVQQRYPPGAPVLLEQQTKLTNEATVAQLLQQHGYETGFVGKWMLGGEILSTPDFRDVVALRRNNDFARQFIKRFGFGYAERVYGASLVSSNLPPELQYHNLEWVNEGALNFINQSAPHKFFLYYASTGPHYPRPSESLDHPYYVTPLGRFPLPPAIKSARASVKPRVLAAGFQDDGYQAGVTWFDDMVVALLDKLAATNADRRTMVVMMSDNQRGEYGKFTCYDAALVPFMVRWPAAVAPGSVSSRIAANIDVLPTILDAAGIPPPPGIDGTSLLPLLRGAAPPNWRSHLLLEIAYTRAIVTEDRWKYLAIRYPPSILARLREDRTLTFDQAGLLPGHMRYARYYAAAHFPHYFARDQLYDLGADPREQTNLYADPAHAAKARELRQLMQNASALLPNSFGEFTSSRSTRPPPSASPSPPSPSLPPPAPAPALSGKCGRFCPTKTHAWEERCRWRGCSGCSECATSPALPTRRCLPFCARKTEPWHELCRWNGCGGCSESPSCSRRPPSLPPLPPP